MLIRLDDADIEGKSPIRVFEPLLESGLGTAARTVGMHLRPEIPCSGEVLAWLESWTKKYARAGKRLLIAPGTAEQLECLETSHPDQGLMYVSDSSEMEDLHDEPEPAAAEPVPSQAAPAAAPIVPETVKPPQLSVAEPSVPSAPAPEFETGHLVEISGEYSCRNCGVTRMYLKGDTLLRCDNQECFRPESGWRLACDIF